MIVVDASALVGALLQIPPGSEAFAARDAAAQLSAPEILVPEVLGAVRRLERRRHISAHRARSAVDDLLGLDLALYPHRPLSRRAFELRANMTMADALYVTLAEMTGSPLLSVDRRLARAAARHTAVAVVP